MHTLVSQILALLVLAVIAGTVLTILGVRLPFVSRWQEGRGAEREAGGLESNEGQGLAGQGLGGQGLAGQGLADQGGIGPASRPRPAPRPLSATGRHGTQILPLFEIQCYGPTGVITGPLYEVPQGFTIGSAPTADLCIPSPYVSAVHARIGRDEKGWFLVDAGSTNHVFVNGEQVEQADITDGTQLFLGPVKLVFAARKPFQATEEKPGSTPETGRLHRQAPPASGSQTRMFALPQRGRR